MVCTYLKPLKIVMYALIQHTSYGKYRNGGWKLVPLFHHCIQMGARSAFLSGHLITAIVEIGGWCLAHGTWSANTSPRFWSWIAVTTGQQARGGSFHRAVKGFTVTGWRIVGLPSRTALSAVETDHHRQTPSTAHVEPPLVPTTSSEQKFTRTLSRLCFLFTEHCICLSGVVAD